VRNELVHFGLQPVVPVLAPTNGEYQWANRLPVLTARYFMDTYSTTWNSIRKTSVSS
jgi:hypothetical protein